MLLPSVRAGILAKESYCIDRHGHWDEVSSERKPDEEEIIDREEEFHAKQQLVAAMQEGQRWNDAVTLTGLPLHRSAAYHLVKRVHTEGEEAYIDHRHGHPSKMRTPLRDWLVAYCRRYPDHSARLIQAALQSECDTTISIGHINFLRRQLGISRGKKLLLNHRGVRERRKSPVAGGSAGNGAALSLRRGASSSC